MFSLIKSTTKIGAFLIIIFGGSASLWSNCLLITNLKQEMRSYYFISSGYDEYNTIIWTIQLTYLCIFIIASGTLLWAFEKSRRKFMIPWSLLKFCENIILVVCSFTLQWDFEGLFVLGIIAFVLNVYISLSVYRAYKKMKLQEVLNQYENDLKGIVQNVICEKLDKASQTDTPNFTIEIKKSSHNQIGNDKDNPFNYIHTNVSNKT